MIAIKTVENKGEKTRITLEVMNALPEWFSPPGRYCEQISDTQRISVYCSF